MSPYYAAPDRPAGVVWVDPSCRSCDGFIPVASRQGVPHPLAEYLCLEHLLSALGVASEALKVPAPIHDGAARAAFRARNRVLTDTAPQEAIAGRQAPPVPLEPELLEAALLTMTALGAAPLRTERTFGVPVAMGCHWRPPGKTPRAYEPGRPVAWDLDSEARAWPDPAVLDPDDEAVPNAARTLAKAALKSGWALRITAGRETLILRATRDGAMVLIRYERGRHAAGHLKVNGVTMALDAKRLGAILRAT